MTDEPRRALVIGAHPDDNEFGAGGSVAKLVKEGWQVTFIICTNGNKGTHDLEMSPYHLSETREQEQRAAAEVLGVEKAIFLRSQISIALAELPEKQRTILLLRDGQGLAYAEIADVLGISLAAVKVNLFRARNAFRHTYTGLERRGEDTL